jgi:hypothetical protein
MNPHDIKNICYKENKEVYQNTFKLSKICIMLANPNLHLLEYGRIEQNAVQLRVNKAQKGVENVS